MYLGWTGRSQLLVAIYLALLSSHAELGAIGVGVVM